MLYISWESSLLLIIKLNIAIGTCGMSIGLLIGSFASSSIKSFYISLFVYLINIMLSGIFWPLDNTDLLLVSVFLPLCIPIRRFIKLINTIASCDNLQITLHPVVSDDIFNYMSRNELPAEVGGSGKSHSFFNDELYNDLVDIRDDFLEQNAVLNNQMMYVNHRLEEDDE
ncbi:unnamed protein product [Macrosiphum euphorbiae]|uniref:Uncharacterized protein n=1 Tax=Macrosiphum euphorbiae TaxID=13131 RepID=A0AAV0W254_9HEMI|nr:unnamed protein product [Macrosiphum euphorbiae]